MIEDLDAVLEWLFDGDVLADEAVERRARELLLDTLGCMAAGFQNQEVGEMTKRLAALDGGAIRLPGAGEDLTPSNAAFVAAVAACWDEACERLARAHGRPGLHAFAPVLALALAHKRSLGDALRSLVVGYEVGGRLGEVLRIRRGMHVDGTWGLFAGAASAVWLDGGDAAAAHIALNAAACQVPFSLYLPVAAGATIRNTYAGSAAAPAVRLVAAIGVGISTPDNAVAEFAARALGLGPTDLTLAQPGEWFITQGYLKPFAAARHVHYGAQAALDWRACSGSGTSQITALRLHTYEEAMIYCGNRAPEAALQAQFSLTYGVAHALVLGSLDPGAYTPEALRDPEVLRLEELIELDVNGDADAGGRGARLDVTTSKGSESVGVDQVAGDPGARCRRHRCGKSLRVMRRRYSAAKARPASGTPFSRAIWRRALTRF